MYTIITTMILIYFIIYYIFFHTNVTFSLNAKFLPPRKFFETVKIYFLSCQIIAYVFKKILFQSFYFKISQLIQCVTCRFLEIAG